MKTPREKPLDDRSVARPRVFKTHAGDDDRVLRHTRVLTDRRDNDDRDNGVN